MAKIAEFSLSAVPDSSQAFPSDEELVAKWMELESAIGPLDGRQEGERERGREDVRQGGSEARRETA